MFTAKTLLDELRKLIKLIEHALKEFKLRGQQEDLYSQWLEILKNLNAILNGYQILLEGDDPLADYWLASVTTGLNMYFSYFDMGWIEDKEDIDSVIGRLDIIAASMLPGLVQQVQGLLRQANCGQHEDNACFIAPMTQRVDINKHNNPELGNDIGNFVTLPTKKTVRAGTKLYRVVGPNNLVKGAWWALDLPQNKTQWRSRYAVLSEWNTDNFYVEFELKNDEKLWIGPAASQKVWWKDKNGNTKYPNTGCILRGGSEQIWIDINHYPDLIPNNLPLKKTGW